MADPDRRVIYKGRKIDLALQTVALADGTPSDREVILHRGAVALLAMVDRDRVCLVKNGRIAVDKTLLEVPAGTLDEGESPDECAPRELREETGYVAGKLTKIAEWWVSPGLFTERMFLYLCEDLSPGPTEHQPDERLEPVVVPWSEALEMVRDGRIDDAKSMLAILIGESRTLGRESLRAVSRHHLDHQATSVMLAGWATAGRSRMVVRAQPYATSRFTANRDALMLVVRCSSTLSEPAGPDRPRRCRPSSAREASITSPARSSTNGAAVGPSSVREIASNRARHLARVDAGIGLDHGSR